MQTFVPEKGMIGAKSNKVRTILPSSMRKGWQRRAKSSFLEENARGETDLETISSQSEGKNLSQIMSESMADRNEEETSDDLHASNGQVREKTVATHSSGSTLK